MKCVSYSAHARRRLLSLRIGEAEVEKTLREPLVVHPGSPWGRPSMVVVGEHIRVVTEPGTLHVITVTLRSRGRYVHGVHDRFNPPDEPVTAA